MVGALAFTSIEGDGAAKSAGVRTYRNIFGGPPT